MTLLQEAMSELNERERHIIQERRLKDEPATLEELSVQYGVSRERVRQIEVRAFEKLQKAMNYSNATRASPSTQTHAHRALPPPGATAAPATSRRGRTLMLGTARPPTR
jgi:hypothetical protein